MGRGLKLIVGTLTLVCACSEPSGLTQTIVFIDAEAAARVELASIEVQAVGPSGRREPRVEAEEPRWPVKLVLTPKNGDPRRRFRLEVEVRDADHVVRTALRIESGFVANQTRYARVILRDTCIERPAPACNADEPDCNVWALELDPRDFGRSENGLKTWRVNCVGQGIEPPDQPGENPGTPKPGEAGSAGDPVRPSGTAGDGSSGAGGTAGGPPSIGRSGAAGGCADGYIANAGVCVDIDECETFGKCAEHGRCTNLPGTFQCECEAGFQETSGACTDIDECQTENGGCEGTCTNSIGSVACTCAVGEWLKVDRKTCGQLEAARQISLTGSATPMGPRIALDASGNGLAVMTFSDGTTSSLWTRRFIAGTGWAPSPVRVAIDAAGVPSEPRVALDASGHGVVLWLQTADSNADVWAASYDGTKVGTATRLEQNDNGSAYDPAIRLNSAGEGFATWTQSDGERLRVWVDQLRGGAGWSGAMAVPSTSNEAAFAARLALDDAGNASLVWTQAQAQAIDLSSSSESKPWAATFDAASGRWLLPVPLDDTGSASYVNTQMFGVEGRSVAVWPRFADGRVSIISRTFVPPTGWSDAVAIATDTSEFTALVPSVSLSAAGNGAAVWTQTQGTTIRVLGSRYDGANGTWSEVSTLRMRTGATAPLPQIAVDPAGDGLAVWAEFAGTARSIWVWRLQADGGFAEGAQFRTDETTDPPRNSLAHIAVDAQGNGIAVWDVLSDGSYTVWASRFE